MGGPGASVLLHDPLTLEQMDELDLWIQSITNQLEGDMQTGYSFWLKENVFFPETVSQCCFYLSIQDPADYAEEIAVKQVVEYLGYFPPLSRDFFKEQRAHVEEREAHIRERLDAIKATLPPGTILRDYLKEHYHDPDSPFKKIAADLREKFGPLLPPRSKPSFEEITAYVQAMPGKVYEIYYETASNGRWVYHIVDTTFMRAWLNHPRFRMTK